MIYLDNNATTRPDPVVVEAMLPYWTDIYFNPASVVGELVGVSHPIRAAKEALAQLIGGEPHEFYLTSGATESNNWALQSIALRRAQESGACRIVTSAIEHPSILETLQVLHRIDQRIQYKLTPVLSNGQIDCDSLDLLVTPDTDLVSIMLANNESGVIQPVEKAAEIIRTIAPTCIIHTDATQAVGKIPLSLNGPLQNVDLLSLSAHKVHGPKGIGALFIREGTQIQPWLHGGKQQDGMRAGTDNPALAAGLAKAAETAKLSLGHMRSVGELRVTLESALTSARPEIRVLGSEAPRLPNTSLLLFPDQEGEMLVHGLLEHGIVCSTGSACSNGTDQPSHVVIAMGVPYNRARNVLRISLSRMTNSHEVDEIIRILIRSRCIDRKMEKTEILDRFG